MRTFRLAVIVAAAGLPCLAVLSSSSSASSTVPFLFPALHAQTPATLVPISGLIGDTAGGVLPGVRVELLRDGAVVQWVFSDARGEFRFVNVPAGEYELRTTLAGFATIVQRIAVGTVEVAGLRLVMGVGPLEESVRVSGSAPLASRMESGVTGGLVAQAPPFNREAYGKIDDNPFRRVADEPVSTFSTDVDTASYANVRRFLNDGRLPPPDAVRIEELINYFKYNYPAARGDAPLSVTAEVAPCPWNPGRQLVLVGLRARPLDERTPQRNLVFLLDVSGSMQSADKLPLVQSAMRMLTETLTPQDRVAIVVYAGASGLVLPSTSGDRRLEIDRAIANLRAGGSTNGASGIQLAYDTAAAHFVKDGVNRVILATDGDFNVGITSQGDLVRLIETQRERGIFLSVLGVGTGNLQDHTMEMLADRGNGNYSYLDSLQEARRVLIDEAGSTLVTVAKDVKIQIEFNPATVGAYRLVGYENRMLDRQDFNDDRKDAGDLGAGDTVTALYELIPPGETVSVPAVNPLIYQRHIAAGGRSSDLMTVSVRYKAPDEDESDHFSIPVRLGSSDRPSGNLAFAAAVAQFGMLLRDSEFKGEASWASARGLAGESRGDDPDGYRAEFIRLIDLAAALESQSRSNVR